MTRLAQALAGDWRTTETIERSAFSPQGGTRRGTVHARLVAGGTTLVYEVHSDGPAGTLDGMLVIWWEPREGQYRFFTCFNIPDNPCEMRGTAHWEGETFVNDYEQTVGGRATRFRDTFSFTPTSHTLVAGIDRGNGIFERLITTKAGRA